MTTVIRVISLKNSPRREGFHRPPEGYDLSWQFLDATTELIEDVSVDEKRCLINNGRLLTKGEIACYCSHLIAWRELILDESISQMIVFEDDAYVDWGVISLIQKVNWSEIGINYLKLLVKYPASFRTLAWSMPIKDRHLVSYTSLALGAVAYVITRKAAIEFMALARIIERPIDVLMDRPWATKIPVIGIVPVSAIELSLPTQIIGREKLSYTDRRDAVFYLNKVVERVRILLYKARVYNQNRSVRNRLRRLSQ